MCINATLSEERLEHFTPDILNFVRAILPFHTPEKVLEAAKKRFCEMASLYSDDFDLDIDFKSQKLIVTPKNQ